jgi:hypothetical protein
MYLGASGQMSALRALIISFIVSGLAAWVSAAKADDLVMPYGCEMDHGAPRLFAARPTAYHIIGAREDRPFSACASPSADACETMMIHKFAIECGGQKVAWATVAASAPSVGIELPRRLPAGFAPISRFQARLVLPGFGHTTRLPTVARQSLSADSVIETGALGPRSSEPNWKTVVDPAVLTSSPAGAFKVAGVLSTLLVMLMAACLLVARRRVPSNYDFSGSSYSANASAKTAWGFARSTYDRALEALRRVGQTSGTARAGGGDQVGHSLAVVHARLVEAELAVATLPADLLLRGVLQTELDGLRARAADVARRAGRLEAKQSAAKLRAIVRDLDRITRVVHGATQKDAADGAELSDMPSTVFEAYRILGLNPEAPPAAVKKVVDALRMSWHPDHARNEADRRHREQRIKQINAAWDLLKAAQATAA